MQPQRPQPPQQWGSPPRPPKRTSPTVIVLAVIGGVLALCLVIGGIGALLTGGQEGGTSDPPVAKAPTTAAAVADSPELDEPGNFACTDLAKGYKAAQTTAARTKLADKVNEWASKSKTARIADAAAALGRTADGNNSAWQLAADTLAVACTDAGWSADTAK